MELPTLALTVSTREGLRISSSCSSYGWSGCFKKSGGTRERGGMLCVLVFPADQVLKFSVVFDLWFRLVCNGCFKFSVLVPN
jgi:hypothetical protein